MGIDAVRLALLEKRMAGFKANTALAWLAEKEAEAQALREAGESDLATKSLNLTERQTLSAEMANDIAKAANTIAIVAAIMAAVAIVVSILAILVSIKTSG